MAMYGRTDQAVREAITFILNKRTWTGLSPAPKKTVRGDSGGASRKTFQPAGQPLLKRLADQAPHPRQ